MGAVQKLQYTNEIGTVSLEKNTSHKVIKLDVLVIPKCTVADCVESGLCTLHCQEYSLIHTNNSFQVFQSLPCPQVHKFKHLGMQTPSTNICERMGCS